MALKNKALTVCYVAWDTAANGGRVGDAVNHALRLVQDGVEASPTNAPAEVDGAAAPGVYSLALTAADMNSNCVVVCGKSGTAGVQIIPLVIVTEQGLIDANVSTRAAPDANGNVPANVTYWDGVPVPAPRTAGVPSVDTWSMGGIELTTQTAQGGSASTIVLAVGANAVDGWYVNQVISILQGTGAGQTRIVGGYAGATLTCTVTRPWLVIPDNTSVYAVGDTALAEQDMAQPVPLNNAAHTVGDCLNAARAQGFGAWKLVGLQLNLYAQDGVTIVHQFNLDSATAPTQRT